MSKLQKISCYSSRVGSTWCIVWPKLCVVSRPTQWAAWHGGLGRPVSAGVVCGMTINILSVRPPYMEKISCFSMNI